MDYKKSIGIPYVYIYQKGKYNGNKTIHFPLY